MSAHPSSSLSGGVNPDTGVLNRVADFGSIEALQADRGAAFGLGDPHGCAASLSHVDRAAYKTLSSIATSPPAAIRPLYEIALGGRPGRKLPGKA